MKKKVAAHYMISKKCFGYYIPEIVKYIESRI